MSFKELFFCCIMGGLIGITAAKLVNSSQFFNEKYINTVFDSTQDEFPALVRLETTDGRFFCSGTVISDEYVLTAAHCIQGVPEAIAEGAKIEVMISSLSNKSGEYLKVISIPLAANYRADYALIKGDFRDFKKMLIETSPASDILYKKNIKLTMCGFPYSASGVCYPSLSEPKKMVDQLGIKGELYVGMSGGPVIDLSTGKIVAVNTAVTQDMVIISPIIGLFESLKVAPIQ